MLHRILFICAGNICRSPALQAVFEHQVRLRGEQDKFHVDSAAITEWYVGCQADSRLAAEAKKRGIHVNHVSRLLMPEDFCTFDVLFGATAAICHEMMGAAPRDEDKRKVHIATIYSSRYPSMDMPDPFYDNAQRFSEILDIAEDACAGILNYYETPAL